MGEAPIFVNDELEVDSQINGFLKPKAGEATIINLQNKSYVIGEAFDVKLRYTKTGDAVGPVELGTKPTQCKGFAGIALDDTRILILKKGSSLDDAIWFLEVDTPYVRELRATMHTDVVVWSKGAIGKAKKPIVISGPSGVGKGTLISMLMSEFPSLFGFSVSHTTRAPRNMEQDGIHYHFTDKDSMMKDIQDGKFLEFASVHGNLYGTSVEAVDKVSDSGKICILDIDVQGARSVKSSPLDAIFIFICPPSMEVLEKRLRARNTESEEQILKRLKNAKDEVEKGKSSGIFNHVLCNDDLQQCYANLKRVLQLDENMLTTRKPSREVIHLPEKFILTKSEDKLVINLVADADQSDVATIVLDCSSLTGGGPTRTRGIKLLLSGDQKNSN